MDRKLSLGSFFGNLPWAYSALELSADIPHCKGLRFWVLFSLLHLLTIKSSRCCSEWLNDQHTPIPDFRLFAKVKQFPCSSAQPEQRTRAVECLGAPDRELPVEADMGSFSSHFRKPFKVFSSSWILKIEFKCIENSEEPDFQTSFHSGILLLKNIYTT